MNMEKSCTKERIPSTTFGSAITVFHHRKTVILLYVLLHREKLETYLLKGMDRKPKILELQNIGTRPKTSFTYFIRVRHSDTDYNYHTNHASYFQFCMDAAAEGAKTGHFQLLKGDLLSYPIESLQCLYKGQSAPGDELLTCVWNDKRMSYQLFAVIEKEKSVIWEGCVKFMDVADI